MAFFEQHKASKPSEKDERRAIQLHGILAKHKLLTVKASAVKWADEFRLLREAPGITSKHVQSVLNWFCENIGAKYTPTIHSARSFRRKFMAIQSAQKRHADKTRESFVPTDIKITPDAQQVVLESGDLIWPGKEKQDELILIQATLNNYNKFLDDFYDFKESAPSDQDVQYFWRTIPGEPRHFTTQWLLRIHNMACNWDKWHGKLLACIWHVDQRWFTKDMEKLALEWDEQSETWHEVKARFQEFLKQG